MIDAIVLDAVTKWLVWQQLQQPLVLVPNVLQLVRVQNENLAFSVGLPGNAETLLVGALLVGLVAWLCKHMLQDRIGYLEAMGWGCIVGGGIGNFVERLLFGSVTDFIAVWRFPIWNVADMALCLGVGLVLLQLVASKKG